jgi:hypothetical protein
MMNMAITIIAELGEAVLTDREHMKLLRITQTLLTCYEIASKHADICSQLEESIIAVVKNSIKGLLQDQLAVSHDQVPSP